MSAATHEAFDYDVIVIGTGAAGLSAAALAADNGASVLMVEAADRTGGSSALSGGRVLRRRHLAPARGGHRR